jgi:hypothetical protein
MFDETKIKADMAAISERFPGERQKLREATGKIAKREAKIRLAITFLQPDLLYSPEARTAVQAAKDKGTKLNEADKEAIIALELGDDKINYDLAKFDCETSRQQFDKLAPQLSYLQSEMKLS